MNALDKFLSFLSPTFKSTMPESVEEQLQKQPGVGTEFELKTPKQVQQIGDLEKGLASLSRAIPRTNLGTVSTEGMLSDEQKKLIGKEEKPVPDIPTGGQEKKKFEPTPGQMIPDFSSREPTTTKPDYVTQTIQSLEKYNIPIEAVAGIMGNILVEAPDADPKTIEKTTSKDKGRGLFQYSKGTDKKGALPFYEKYLEENNLTDSIDNQIGFAMKEILNPKESVWLGYKQANKLKNLLQKGNVKEITKGFLNIFEKPKKGKEHLQRRLDNASNIYQRLMNEQTEYVEDLIKQRKKIQEKQSGGMIEKDPYKRQPRFI